jgi:hypothetical protein
MATDTRYGAVDSAALERLRESFNTRTILDAVDKVDDIRCRIDDLRDDLLKLHAMAHDLINDAGPDGPPPEYPIWDWPKRSPPPYGNGRAILRPYARPSIRSSR